MHFFCQWLCCSFKLKALSASTELNITAFIIFCGISSSVGNLSVWVSEWFFSHCLVVCYSCYQ
jgi:hypothetical protein